MFTLGLLKKDGQRGKKTSTSDSRVCSFYPVIIEVVGLGYLESCSTVVVPVTALIF